MKRSFADILQGLDSDRAQKVARKLPEWAAVGAEIPSALALEQCSSSATAGYKTGLVSYKSVLDLTGGLGVDSWAFSRVAERVVYFERKEELAEAARRNFGRLGAANIEVRCETVTPETELPEADLIYADPARRDAAGRKVFLLEDCTPDILTLLPMLLRKAPTVLLKLSPMADLAMLADRLGSALREIHVVELDGEVKEILCLLVRGQEYVEPQIIVTKLSTSFAGLTGESPRFTFSEEQAADVKYAAELRPGDTLLEPCAALLKAGAFRLPCARWGLQKLAPSTHLYLSSAAPDNGFFKAWQVQDVLPFGAAAFRQLKQRYPRADVTSRNMPLGSAELQKKIGVAPGGDIHIFACRLADSSSILIVTAPAG